MFSEPDLQRTFFEIVQRNSEWRAPASRFLAERVESRLNSLAVEPCREMKLRSILTLYGVLT